MSISLVAVFIPILLMGGMVGRLFREFAVTLSAAILVSLVVSLTTTPMMCATILRPEKTRNTDVLYRASERMLQLDARPLRKEPSLGACATPAFMLLLIVITVATNIVLFIVVPKGFFPEQDTGRIAGNIQAAQDISFQAMRESCWTGRGYHQDGPRCGLRDRLYRGGGGGGPRRTPARMFICA